MAQEKINFELTRKFKLCLKYENEMWGLYAHEDIPANNFIC